METDYGAMPNTPYILCYFNEPFLLTCPSVLQTVEPALVMGLLGGDVQRKERGLSLLVVALAPEQGGKGPVEVRIGCGGD